MDPKNLKYTLYEKDGNIARVTLNNPDKLNALNMLGETEETTEMYTCLKEAALDDDVKVVVFSGKGRALSVGHDLTKVGFVYGFTTKRDDRKPSQRIRLDLDRWAFHDRMMEIMLHPKITIVQCHGYCYGAGMMFPLLMDLAIAAEDALFHISNRLKLHHLTRIGVRSFIETIRLIAKSDLRKRAILTTSAGITGIITIHGRGKRLREFAPLIPVDRLLIETDAPYLVPAPERNRTRRNEPAFLKSILLKLAQVRKEDPEELAAITWANTCRLFNIGSE